MNRINTKKRAGKLAIFLFFTFLSLTTVAQNKEKKITIQNKSISLKEAFAQIELQTGYSIAYEQSNLDIEKKQSLSLKNVAIDKAMTQLLKETGYVYKIKGYHIIISSQDNKQKPAKKKKKIRRQEFSAVRLRKLTVRKRLWVTITTGSRQGHIFPFVRATGILFLRLTAELSRK